MKKIILVFMITFIGFLYANKVNAQTIGPANGTSYEIVSVYYEWQACTTCGYNRLSIPNQCKIKFEHRLYHKYNNEGKEISSWYKDVEIGWTGDCRETS